MAEVTLWLRGYLVTIEGEIDDQYDPSVGLFGGPAFIPERIVSDELWYCGLIVKCGDSWGPIYFYGAEHLTDSEINVIHDAWWANQYPFEYYYYHQRKPFDEPS